MSEDFVITKKAKIGAKEEAAKAGEEAKTEAAAAKTTDAGIMSEEGFGEEKIEAKVSPAETLKQWEEDRAKILIKEYAFFFREYGYVVFNGDDCSFLQGDINAQKGMDDTQPDYRDSCVSVTVPKSSPDEVE